MLSRAALIFAAQAGGSPPAFRQVASATLAFANKFVFKYLLMRFVLSVFSQKAFLYQLCQRIDGRLRVVAFCLQDQLCSFRCPQCQQIHNTRGLDPVAISHNFDLRLKLLREPHKHFSRTRVQSLLILNYDHASRRGIAHPSRER